MVTVSGFKRIETRRGLTGNGPSDVAIQSEHVQKLGDKKDNVNRVTKPRRRHLLCPHLPLAKLRLFEHLNTRWTDGVYLIASHDVRSQVSMFQQFSFTHRRHRLTTICRSTECSFLWQKTLSERHNTPLPL